MCTKSISVLHCTGHISIIYRLNMLSKTHLAIRTKYTAKCYSSIRRGLRLPACDEPAPVYKGPSYDSIVEGRARALPPVMRPHFSKPLLIQQGRMQWLYDHTGTRYLDMFGGIVTVSVGHCHPRITKVIQEQCSRLCHVANVYMHPQLQEYADRLLNTFPDPLKVVYFVNSGSEANELAVMLARLSTGNQDFISLRNCYHGGTPTCIALNAQGTWKFPQTTTNMHHVKNADVYMGEYGGCRDSPVQTNRGCACKEGPCSTADLYARDVIETIKYSVPPKKLAGFIAESIQGVGGVVQFPVGYLAAVYKAVREAGGVCVADEVQTGFARTGTHFWGFQGHKVVPDIVTMAKGIGNGFPMAAVVTTPQIAQHLDKALHYNTFSANPLACAVGNEVLRVIEDEGLQANSLEVGTHLLSRLATLRDNYPEVGDVRGKGLMIGVEMVCDPASRSPMPPTAVKAMWETCREQGLLIGLGGIHGNVFRISPPMCVTKEDADFTADVIEYALQKNLPKV